MNKLIYVGGDMSERPCKTCKWSAKPNDSSIYCDYLVRTGHSRTFGSDGRKRLPHGFCDKYEEVVKDG